MNEPLCGNSLMDYSWSQKIGRTYSELMERVIDAIRSTGAEQLIFIDRPYVWGLDSIYPIDRSKIVWEDHLYVTQSVNIADWKAQIDDKIQRFVYDFGKPLYIGEYGTTNPEKPRSWQDVLSEEVAYLETKPICGRQWNAWGQLEGEYLDSVYDYYTAEETEWIITALLG
jgi:hypothetical protein